MRCCSLWMVFATTWKIVLQLLQWYYMGELQLAVAVAAPFWSARRYRLRLMYNARASIFVAFWFLPLTWLVTGVFACALCLLAAMDCQIGASFFYPIQIGVCGSHQELVILMCHECAHEVILKSWANSHGYVCQIAYRCVSLPKICRGTVRIDSNQNSVRRKQKTTAGKCDISSLFEETAWILLEVWFFVLQSSPGVQPFFEGESWVITL